MANILKVTTPSTGYDNNNQNVAGMPKNPTDLRVQAPVDPSRVMKPERESDAENKTQWQALNYESNFSSFVRMLRETPQLVEIFPMLFGQGVSVEAGIGPNTTREVAAFLQMMNLDPEQLEGFLKEQADGAVKFSGPFFGLLRQIMTETRSVDLKSGILAFLKHYDGMSSGEHLLARMEESLNQMSAYMMRSDRKVLQELAQKLDLKALPGQTEKNGAELKEEILPWLAGYIRKTHDRGAVRDLVSMLILDTARYESGDKEVLLNDLRELFQYPGLREAFGGMTEEEIVNLLAAQVKERGETGGSGWAETFVEQMRQALSGEKGTEGKQIFQNLMNALILNESVYMPVMHMMLPLQIGGQMMFSEMWVDPDAEKREQGQEAGGGGRRIKMLIKFDIKDVGFFDMVLVYQDGQADLQLSCPGELKGEADGIRIKLGSILEDKGIGVRNLALAYGAPSRKVSDVFPQIFERSNTVNVTV